MSNNNNNKKKEPDKLFSLYDGTSVLYDAETAEAMVKRNEQTKKLEVFDPKHNRYERFLQVRDIDPTLAERRQQRLQRLQEGGTQQQQQRQEKNKLPANLMSLFPIWVS
jgi:hypothetical protein